jgi:hypothetical protein
MSINAERVAGIQQQLQQIETDVTGAWIAWDAAILNAARDPTEQPKVAPAEARVQEEMRKWRALINDLQQQAEERGEGGALQEINHLMEQVADEKQLLAKLRAEAGTRSEQGDSLHPKVRPSPYTNILGLQRTFRDSTRNHILWVSVLFGILALSALGYLVYQVVVSGGQLIKPSAILTPSTSFMVGGGGDRIRIF